MRRVPCSMLLRVPAWRAAGETLQLRILARGLLVSVDEATGCLVLATMALSACLGLASGSALGVAVGLVAGIAGVEIWHAGRMRARERALVDEMPEVLRTLAMALGSGETLMQAIEYVGMHEGGYAAPAFVNTALRLRCGSSVEEAMARLSEELDAPGVELLTCALVIAQRTGSPLRKLLQSSAALVERQGEYDRLLAVKTAQVRLSVRVVCLLPVVLVLGLSLISVDFQHGVGTLPGTLSLLVAAAMDGSALLILRRLMQGVIE
jgi:tight adherence protein B